MTAPVERISSGVTAVALAMVAWSVVLLVIASATSNEKVVQIATGLGVVVGLVGGLLPVLANAGIVFPRRGVSITRPVLIRAATVLGLINLVVTVAWGSWALYQANRVIDVTALVATTDNDDVLPGERVVFEVETDPRRSHLVVVFRVTDTNPTIGTCLPNTRLTVTSSTSGNPSGTRTAVPGEPLTVPMAPDTRRLTLDVQVQNIRDDRNCAVDVSVASARLANG